jgi:hypothetical protein
MRTHRWNSVLALALVAVPAAAHGQGTLADYRRAAALGDRLDGLVINEMDTPEWIGDSHRFWYRKSVTGGNEFILVDATTRERRPAFDHARLARAFGTAADSSWTATTLPFNTFDFVDGARTPLRGVIQRRQCAQTAGQAAARRG